MVQFAYHNSFFSQHRGHVFKNNVKLRQVTKKNKIKKKHHSTAFLTLGSLSPIHLPLPQPWQLPINTLTQSPYIWMGFMLQSYSRDQMRCSFIWITFQLSLYFFPTYGSLTCLQLYHEKALKNHLHKYLCLSLCF